MDNEKISSDLLVVGAGIAGITAAVEAAETGINVILIEKNPYIGGKVSQFNKYFPKLCPPSCGLEINTRRLRTNPLIKLLTLAEVTDIEGVKGNYNVAIKIKPRYINNQCTSCGDCVQVCPEKRKNEFNYGMDETSAIYLAYENAYPQKHVIDKAVCKGSSCNKCVEVCKYKAIDLDQPERELIAEVKSVIWATGWEPYDAKNLDILGFGKIPDVITNVMMERLASPGGPTNGKIVKPSNKEEIKSVAFVQCAGSRDENHLEYCSSVCCMASLKQTRYVREQYPEADIHIFYIDIRSGGLLEDFYNLVQQDNKIHLHRGKVAKVLNNDSAGSLIVEAEDTLTGMLMQQEVDMVVLATGMKPSTENLVIDKKVIDRYGFLVSNGNGTIACGVATKPQDVAATVREATGSVLRAIQIINGN
jgi:quinone-modifying oxidoreductase, subunit QmoA